MVPHNSCTTLRQQADLEKNHNLNADINLLFSTDYGLYHEEIDKPSVK